MSARVDKVATPTPEERDVILRAIAAATLRWALDELARNPRAADDLTDDDAPTLRQKAG
jgi:hypothetical protein